MKATHTKIHAWYQANGRHTLPWRTTHDPYAIYLSEVMLQQTQVKTVLERYYFPFLERFPTLQSLGEAPLDDVLKLWEGLGYYTRARNLHKTATQITQLPEDIDALIKLPGIGKNTAHAIAVFAFKQPVPIMEANVKRILCRIHTLTTPTPKGLWEIAYRMVDHTNPFDYNQALMDIGSTVCLPKNPHCHTCPFEAICQGKEEPTRYPTKIKKQTPTRHQQLLLYSHQNTLALTQRTGRFLHGLWGFEVCETLPSDTVYLGEVTQTYTHFKLTAQIHLCRESTPTQSHYFSIEEIERLALSKVDAKIVKLFLDKI